MTSIEVLLDTIEHYHDEEVYYVGETYVENEFAEEIKIIRKELEVLEILKRGLAHADITQYPLRQRGKDRLPNIVADMHIELTEEEYMKVKEWLENGE